jgi:organic radical activating enzyme
MPHKIKERELMLSGKWPTIENGGSGHCNHCKKVEDGGGISDRINMLQQPNQVPPEMESDPTATFVTPRILEIFMNDTCNLKCVYCGPQESSKWKNELKKHGAMIEPNGDPIKGLDPESSSLSVNKDQRFFLEKTKDWLLRNAHSLSRLHLLGGETFYQKELDEILETLENTQARNLELNIVSNLMVKEERFVSVIERIKKMLQDRKIGRFDLSASIDGWGAEAEYARTGLKCDHFEKLFSYAVNQKWMRLHVNLTVTAMTVRAMPDLINKVIEYRKQNPKITIRAGAVTGSPYLHVSAFGRNFWEDDLENILSVWPKERQDDIDQMEEIKGQFLSIKNEMPEPTLVRYFKHYLDQLDKRRNTNWREVLPYLDI